MDVNHTLKMLSCRLDISHDYDDIVDDYDDVSFVGFHRIHKVYCNRCGKEKTTRIKAPGAVKSDQPSPPEPFR